MKTQEKVLLVKKLMEEIIAESEQTATSVKEANLPQSAVVSRMLFANIEEYKRFIVTQWEHVSDKRENSLLLRLNQCDKLLETGEL